MKTSQRFIVMLPVAVLVGVAVMVVLGSAGETLDAVKPRGELRWGVRA